MLDVTHPDAVLAGARDDEVAMTAGLRLGGGGAHRVPFALAALSPFGADAGTCDAPLARRFRRARPVGERPLDSFEPFRLVPQVDRRPGGGGRGREQDGEAGKVAHGGVPRRPGGGRGGYPHAPAVAGQRGTWILLIVADCGALPPRAAALHKIRDASGILHFSDRMLGLSRATPRTWVGIAGRRPSDPLAVRNRDCGDVRGTHPEPGLPAPPAPRPSRPVSARPARGIGPTSPTTRLTHLCWTTPAPPRCCCTASSRPRLRSTGPPRRR